MREILFRGKAKINGYWVYGDLVRKYIEKHSVCMVGGYHVDEKTVGQYTGIKDINGKKIFEGDIVLWNGELGNLGVVKWSNNVAGFVAVDTNEHLEWWIKSNCWFVYGNIYDNSDWAGDICE